METDAQNLFKPWFDENSTGNVKVLTEKDDGRFQIFEVLVSIAVDHVVGLKTIESLGGFPRAMHILRHRVPAGKIARSGFLGEILATEYVEQQTEFAVPVRRLRYRDTREQAMRGDDVLGFCKTENSVKVMKVEAKSRTKLDSATLAQAREGLANHEGRPNPETLAFLECNLRERDRDDEADLITELQRKSTEASDNYHLIFTLSGNDPTKFLKENGQPVREGFELRLCGCQVKNHADFVKTVFDTCMAKGNTDGVT